MSIEDEGDFCGTDVLFNFSRELDGYCGENVTLLSLASKQAINERGSGLGCKGSKRFIGL